ncbi:hypothetical protein FA101_22425 [Pseudomonas aeruginosa]|uniref:hypothetical protein n=1 Tax=Pseudomonas aeruginosa TaxID=287 RepID=UPI000EADC77A|nr:hypothetical protein [Pseudomonas aeruginosa]MBV6099732.1 hypothetical protein [Pseudomonas aeruginosa]MCK1837268.1 hypothetical protein [Pseudomonas aeruginosa]MCO4066527.1 hypothetical protein [Pseudomonas aeruginosa]RUC24511.1 hypothetical protein IPC1407_03460 [Pseudomonas aeruginosa]RUC62638.1 hypothetical protein IPC1401_03500 [Pseudomonas aeruginosa]
MTDEVIDVAVEPTGQEVELAQEADISSTDQAAVQEAEQQEQQEEPKAKKPDAWVQKRIDQLTREKYEERRRTEALQQENETYRRLLEAQKDGEKIELPTQQKSDQDPYELAKQIRRHEEFNDRCNKAYEQGKTEFADFDDSIKNLQLLGQIPQDFLEAVTELEKPHAVLYALAQDLDNAARILSLPPVQQGRELERIALKAAAPKAKPVSKAPAPIAPIDGSPSVEADPTKMSMDQWVKWRESQLAQR